jgi:predicted nucleic acid-binding protein
LIGTTGITRPHFLIDTVAAVARLNGDPAITLLFDADVDVSVPIITLGELYGGAEKSARAAENIQRIDIFAEGADIFRTYANCIWIDGERN